MVNVLIVVAILFLVALFVFHLMGRRCRHQWETAETWQKKDHVVYIMRCNNCGTLKKKVIR
jgi:hypothetical protein